MTVITIVTQIRATPEQCFDASRNLDLHLKSMSHTGERAVAGRMSGLIEMGEQVTWQGRHFGVVQRFTSAITAYERPRHFQDSMVNGAFRSFVHDHYFEENDGGTRMTDVLVFRSPFGFLGAMIDRLLMTKYLTRLLMKRNEVVKAALET